MNERVLELYGKCMNHNITITVKTLLSDAAIEIKGDCLAYYKVSGEYEHLRHSKWIQIEEMLAREVDLLEYTINEIFQELLERKEGIENVNQ